MFCFNVNAVSLLLPVFVPVSTFGCLSRGFLFMVMSGPPNWSFQSNLRS